MNKLFSSNPQTVNLTAFVNWRTVSGEGPDNLIVLGNGFFDSSLILLTHAIENNWCKIADSIIFPIIHNVNHAIELHLKAIEYSINNLLNNGKIFSGGHDILQLFQTIIAKIELLEGRKISNEFNRTSEILVNYAKEIYLKVDNVKNSQKLEFARYPVTPDKRDAHFYVKSSENVEIDLVNYKVIVEGIKDVLRQMIDQFHYQYEQ